MKKIIVLSLVFAAFLGAKEPNRADVFLKDAASAQALRSFLKENLDEIAILNLSYCADKDSQNFLDNKASERADWNDFNVVSQLYKLSDEVDLEYFGKNYDAGEGWKGEVNAAIDEGELIIKYRRDGSLRSLVLQPLDSARGKRYAWRYVWDETSRCADGEVRLEGAFYVARGKYPVGSKLSDEGYDIFALDPIAKKYLKLLQYR